MLSQAENPGVITCQIVTSVHDLLPSTKRIAKFSNFVRQRKDRLREKVGYVVQETPVNIINLLFVKYPWF